MSVSAPSTSSPIHRAHYYLGVRASNDDCSRATSPTGRPRKAPDWGVPSASACRTVQQGTLFASSRGLGDAIRLVLTSPPDFARLLSAVRSLSGAAAAGSVYEILSVHAEFVARYPSDSCEVHIRVESLRVGLSRRGRVLSSLVASVPPPPPALDPPFLHAFLDTAGNPSPQPSSRSQRAGRLTSS